MTEASQNLTDAVEAGDITNEDRLRMEQVARARISPRPEGSGFLAGFVAGMALASAWFLTVGGGL